MNDYLCYSGTAAEWSSPSAWADVVRIVLPIARKRNQRDASALPGEAITAAISENERQRRTLVGILVRMAAARDITRTAFHTAESFLDALPRNKGLPKVIPDGEGGLVMAWAFPGQPRTLVTLADWTLYPVVRAGSPQAAYLPDTPFDGVIPDEVLAVIPG